MSQHDFNIANQTAPNARTDINNALTALASLSSGSTAPATTVANMLWYDTGTNILKMRAEADDAWIPISYFNQSTDTFNILDDTEVVNTSGTQTGLLGGQNTAAWETGTETLESLVSPANIKAAILALVSTDNTGFSSTQSWTDKSASRALNTTYTNSTGRMIQVSVTGKGNFLAGIGYQTYRLDGLIGGTVICSTQEDGQSVAQDPENFRTLCFNVPNGSTYRFNSTGAVGYWYELG